MKAIKMSTTIVSKDNNMHILESLRVYANAEK